MQITSSSGDSKKMICRNLCIESIGHKTPFAEGVPQNYIYDQKGRLIYYGSGSIPENVMNTFFTVR